jgi:hypothetical protein
MSAFSLGQTDVTVYFRAYNTDGTEKTDAAHNTSGLSMGFIRERAAEVSATVGGTPAPVSLAADDTAHTDWGFRNIVGNYYRADFPDAMAEAAGAPKFVIPYVRLSGCTFVVVQPEDLLGANPRSASADANVVSMAATPRNEIAAAVRDDQIDMLKEGMSLPTGNGNISVKRSDGTTDTIAVTRGTVTGGIVGLT